MRLSLVVSISPSQAQSQSLSMIELSAMNRSGFQFSHKQQWNVILFLVRPEAENCLFFSGQKSITLANRFRSQYDELCFTFKTDSMP